MRHQMKRIAVSVAVVVPAFLSLQLYCEVSMAYVPSAQEVSHQDMARQAPCHTQSQTDKTSTPSEESDQSSCCEISSDMLISSTGDLTGNVSIVAVSLIDAVYSQAAAHSAHWVKHQRIENRSSPPLYLSHASFLI